MAFVDLGGHNFLLPGPEASTDEGNPADAVADEPTPNGARINLGAFGGTADAELSVPAAVTGAPGRRLADPLHPDRHPPPGRRRASSAAPAATGAARSGAARPERTSWIVVLAALALVRRRRAARGRGGNRITCGVLGFPLGDGEFAVARMSARASTVESDQGAGRPTRSSGVRAS